jgi:rhodanese-related sulfurtransferase
MKIKRLTIQIIIIIIISVFCGVIYNSISESGISLIYKPLKLESGSYLSIEQTMTLLNEGRTLFIDTRYKDEFEKGHLKNAYNVPANATREEIMNFFESIPKDQQIVTYCSSPACNSSRRLAGFLTYLGYTKVLIYLEGYKEWEAKNYPIED